MWTPNIIYLLWPQTDPTFRNISWRAHSAIFWTRIWAEVLLSLRSKSYIATVLAAVVTMSRQMVCNLSKKYNSINNNNSTSSVRTYEQPGSLPMQPWHQRQRRRRRRSGVKRKGARKTRVNRITKQSVSQPASLSELLFLLLLLLLRLVSKNWEAKRNTIY